MISGKNLKVGYEQKIIIEDLSIKVNKGEVVSIIGPNGCGKSTLLKTLSRMIKPISGNVYIEDKDIKIANVTLHVGIGTFRPVKEENIEDHKNYNVLIKIDLCTFILIYVIFDLGELVWNLLNRIQ